MVIVKQRVLIGLSFALSLGACSVPSVETSKKLATDLKDNIYTTSYQIKEWALTPPQAKPGSREIGDSYCYRAQTDILCYNQPMPGWENRLVAYQGTVAKPPAPPTMQLLAKQVVDESVLPANKAASSIPVFTTLPALTKEKEKSSEPQVLDSSHELLPDPSLAPQL